MNQLEIFSEFLTSKKYKVFFLALLIVLSFTLPTLAQSGGVYNLSRHTINSSGTSSGGNYAVAGTIGQSDTGEAMSGGNYNLAGGFWGTGGEAASSPSENDVYLPIVIKGN